MSSVKFCPTNCNHLEIKVLEDHQEPLEKRRFYKFTGKSKILFFLCLLQGKKKNLKLK